TCSSAFLPLITCLFHHRFFFFVFHRLSPPHTLFPYTTLFRSALAGRSDRGLAHDLTTGHVTLVLDAGVVLDHSVVLDHGPLPHVRGVTGLHAMAHTCLVTDHRPVDL